MVPAKQMPDNVPGLLQLLQAGADSLRALLADRRKALGRKVPVVRQAEHHGKKPLGL